MWGDKFRKHNLSISTFAKHNLVSYSPFPTKHLGSNFTHAALSRYKARCASNLLWSKMASQVEEYISPLTTRRVPILVVGWHLYLRETLLAQTLVALRRSDSSVSISLTRLQEVSDRIILQAPYLFGIDTNGVFTLPSVVPVCAPAVIECVACRTPLVHDPLHSAKALTLNSDITPIFWRRKLVRGL